MMTEKQREELSYISGWILGMSYIAEQTVADGLLDVSQCIDQLLREDKDGSDV